MDAITDRIWPPGLTRIPYWVYHDADVLALEQKRIFEGPVWNFLCLEAELPTSATTAPPSSATCRWWWRAPRTATSARSRTAARIAAR